MSQLKCSLIKQKVFKSTHKLPGGESNPGLLSDTQRYLPLYYRGLLLSEICCSSFPEAIELFINKTKTFQNTHNLPGGESNPGLLSDSQSYLPLYYRGLVVSEMCCSSFPEPIDMFINKTKGFQNNTSSPRRGIELRSPEWQSEILTTILPRIDAYWDLLQFISWANISWEMFINKTKGFQKHT